MTAAIPRGASPLIAALLHVDRKARLLTRAAGSHHRKDALRQATHELRMRVLDVVALNLAEGKLDQVDAATFKAIVGHFADHHRFGWAAMVQAFNDLRQERPSK